MNDANKATVQVSFDWRVISAVLFIIIALMVIVWRPWQSPAPTKTISIRGEATVKATPDLYQFQPVFQDADIKKVTATGNTAVAKLKELGIKNEDIKTTVSAAGKAEPTTSSPARPDIYYAENTFVIAVTVRNKALAQKVSDYLATTDASGQVTPATSFSKDTRSKLDLEARSNASDDAKQKAEVMAKQLGASLGKVVKISEDNGYGIYALDGTASSIAPNSAESAGPTIEPGTDEVNYVFTVVFEIK